MESLVRANSSAQHTIRCRSVTWLPIRTPDHNTIAAFRQRHLEALSKLFVQVLRLCQKAGLVKLGHVAIDGTKINANASTRGNTTYDTLSRDEQYWKEQVDKLFAEAARVDQQETATGGVTADALPEHLADGQERLARIQQAKRQLEEEARLALEQAQAARIAGPGKGHRFSSPPPALQPFHTTLALGSQQMHASNPKES